jgi:hypothetical protein
VSPLREASMTLFGSGLGGDWELISRCGDEGRKAYSGKPDGAVLLEAVGFRGEGFSGGDLCSRDFLPGRGASSAGIIVQDGVGGNRVYCTSVTMYVNLGGMRFPNLLLD